MGSAAGHVAVAQAPAADAPSCSSFCSASSTSFCLRSAEADCAPVSYWFFSVSSSRSKRLSRSRPAPRHHHPASLPPEGDLDLAARGFRAKQMLQSFLLRLDRVLPTFYFKSVDGFVHRLAQPSSMSFAKDWNSAFCCASSRLFMRLASERLWSRSFACIRQGIWRSRASAALFLLFVANLVEGRGDDFFLPLARRLDLPPRRRHRRLRPSAAIADIRVRTAALRGTCMSVIVSERASLARACSATTSPGTSLKSSSDMHRLAFSRLRPLVLQHRNSLLRVRRSPSKTAQHPAEPKSSSASTWTVTSSIGLTLKSRAGPRDAYLRRLFLLRFDEVVVTQADVLALFDRRDMIHAVVLDRAHGADSQLPSVFCISMRLPLSRMMTAFASGLSVSIATVASVPSMARRSPPGSSTAVLQSGPLRVVVRDTKLLDAGKIDGGQLVGLRSDAVRFNVVFDRIRAGRQTETRIRRRRAAASSERAPICWYLRISHTGWPTRESNPTSWALII